MYEGMDFEIESLIEISMNDKGDYDADEYFMIEML